MFGIVPILSQSPSHPPGSPPMTPHNTTSTSDDSLDVYAALAIVFASALFFLVIVRCAMHFVSCDVEVEQRPPKHPVMPGIGSIESVKACASGSRSSA